VAAISLVVAHQSRQLSGREIAALEKQIIDARKAELRNDVQLARKALVTIGGQAPPDDRAGRVRMTQILATMLSRRDGQFLVYDRDGTLLLGPGGPGPAAGNAAGQSAARDRTVADRLLALARAGGGYHGYLWQNPETGKTTRMIAYVTAMPDWRWVLASGVSIDDVLETVGTARAQIQARVTRTLMWIGGITLGLLMVVFLSGRLINIHERRRADAKLKALTQRIFDTQEEERGRVARELHDSISQILVGARYALELARRRLMSGDARAAESVGKAIEGLNGAIHEVRRISRDLRPAVLDDLGLGPAIQALCEEFERRTGIETDFRTVVFRNRLDQEAKIALYRIAQEALTNIERHSGATRVTLRARGDKQGVMLRIQDNGHGMPHGAAREDMAGGLGLRNMAERAARLDGKLRVLSTPDGTLVEARVPLTHMLHPESSRKTSA